MAVQMRLNAILTRLAQTERSCPELAKNLLRRGKPFLGLFCDNYWLQTRQERLKLLNEALHSILPGYRKRLLGSTDLMQLEEQLEKTKTCCENCLASLEGQKFQCLLQEQNKQRHGSALILDEQGQSKRFTEEL